MHLTQVTKKYKYLITTYGLRVSINYLSANIAGKANNAFYYYKNLLHLQKDFYRLHKNDEILLMSPCKINKLIIKRCINKQGIRGGRLYNGERIAGIVMHGEWDKSITLFDNNSTLKSFCQRFVSSKSWDDTFYYYVISVSKHRSWQHFKEKHLHKWDKLYHEIKTNGYANHTKRGKPPTDEIEVAVGRDGQILFIDGKHRLAIAKILELSEIPVIVNIWHHDFIEYVKKETGDKKITPAVAMHYAKL